VVLFLAVDVLLWKEFGPSSASSRPGGAAPRAVATSPASGPPAPAPANAALGSGSTLQSATAFVVSVDTFESPRETDEVVRYLTSRGLPAFARLDEAKARHVVLVGPYLSREEAVDAQRLLKASNFLTTTIGSDPASPMAPAPFGR
jgi:cell division septation protein DedD